VTDLANWGWSKREEALLQPFSGRGLQAARVLAEHRGSYALATDRGEVSASVSGKFRYEAVTAEDFPAVGDWVAVEPVDSGQSAVIHAVLPRQTRFVRPARGPIPEAQVVAANVDLVLLVTGLDHDFNLRRLERYLALAWSSGAEPVVVLNKADLCDDLAGRLADVSMVAPGVTVRVLSALDGTGIDSLTPLLEPGKTVALLGSSGVGKSTIVNALLGYDRQATGAVREDDQRGRHTTTMRELLVMPNGALLIDSPGMRSVGMWEIEDGLADAFADVEEFASRCRFSDCSHTLEPGCAVQAAIAQGALPAARLESMNKLARESAALARRLDPELRANSKRHWKAIHKSVRNHMKLKYGSEAG
jgi:ribosome biogenesis GTPase